jgi:hypothetical protein
LSDNVFRLLRIPFAFARVRKWFTDIGRRTILPFRVIRMRLVKDLDDVAMDSNKIALSAQWKEVYNTASENASPNAA